MASRRTSPKPKDPTKRTYSGAGFDVRPPPTHQEKLAKKARVVTPREQRERLALVEQLLLRSSSYAEIGRALKARYDVGEKTARTLIDQVHERWLDEKGSRTLALEKEAQVQRLRFLIAKCREGKDGKTLDPDKWDRKTMVQAEHEIAKILGTYEPERLELDVVANRTALLLLEQLPAHELDALVLEFDRRQVVESLPSDGPDRPEPKLPH